MSHFATQDWLEFVNRGASPEKQTAMQCHLDSGCESCQKTAGWWQRLLHAASAVMGDSSLAGARGSNLDLVEMLFDSFTQPAPAGVRAGFGATRQLLYRAGPYQVDLHIQEISGSNGLAVTGQLLDLRPETDGTGIPVAMSNGRGQVVRTTTNEFGEFLGEIPHNGELEISLLGPGERSLVISLRHPLGETQ